MTYFNEVDEVIEDARNKIHRVCKPDGTASIIDGNVCISTIPVVEREERVIKPNEAHSYVYVALKMGKKKTEPVKIPASEFLNEKFFRKAFGANAFADFHKGEWKLFFKVAQLEVRRLEPHEIYAYSGWRGDGKQYIMGRAKITADRCEQVESTLTKRELSLSQGSPQQIITQMTDIVETLSSSKWVGYTMLVYHLLSIVKQRIICSHNMAPSFCMALIGSTGTYKTSVTKALFNPMDVAGCSFEDTEPSIRRIFQANRSGATIIDDYKCSSKSNDTKFERIVRFSGDITTTGKIVRGNTVVDEMFTGMSVITGEVYPHLQESSYARILFLSLDENPINPEALTRLQKSSDDYRAYLVLIVQYLLNCNGLNEMLISRFEKHRSQLQSGDYYKNMHGRYYDMYAWLCSMWEVLCDFLEKNGAPVEYDFPKALALHICQQNARYDCDPVRLFVKGYEELRAANKLVILSSARDINGNFDVIERSDVIFIKSGSVFEKIKKYWQSLGIEYSVSERRLRTCLYDSGLLCKHNGANTYEIKTPERSGCSGYDVYKNQMNKIMEEF